jgi:hypothetical protein
MIIFLYRPSPQIPQPSVRAAELCFEAVVYNLHEQRKMIEQRSVDITWIFVQQIFMLTNTLLWTVSVPQIREQHPRTEVETHFENAMQALVLSSERWPGTNAAARLYKKLIKATLKSYVEESEISSVSYSNSTKASSMSPFVERPSQSPISTPSTTAYSSKHPDQGSSSSYGYAIESPQSQLEEHSPQPTLSSHYHGMVPSVSSNSDRLEVPRFQSSSPFQEPAYAADDAAFGLFSTGTSDLTSWKPEYSLTSQADPENTSLDFDPLQFDTLLAQQQQQGSLPYLQDYDYHPRSGSLSQEQQSELMDTLETDGLEYMEGYLEQTQAFFNIHFANPIQNQLAFQSQVSLNLGDV